MKPLDWAVMGAWLLFIVSYGLYRGRGSNIYLVRFCGLAASAEESGVVSGVPSER